MPAYKTRAELKRLAITQLRGKWGTLIGALVVQTLITLVITELPLLIFSSDTLVSNVLYYVLTFILQLLLGVLQAGGCYLYLKAACGMDYQIADLFYCFRNSPDKAIKIEFILALIQVVCLSPYYVLSWRYPVTTSSELDEILILYVVGLLCSAVYAVITLCFTPVFYMMLDFPDYTVREILVESVRVMEGNKWRYLLLQLSFIPWLLLCMMACGIGILWLAPYINMTDTNFYLDLMSSRNKQAEC